MTNVFGQKSKNTTKPKSKHKNLCQSQKSNPVHLALQSDALPLDHRDNRMYCALLFYM